MTAIETAIRDAVEKGGWMKNIITGNIADTGYSINFVGTHGGIEHSRFFKLYGEIFLDFAFWQALGKARGWPETKRNVYGFGAMLTAAYQQHRLLDYLWIGRDAESFFKDL